MTNQLQSRRPRSDRELGVYEWAVVNSGPRLAVRAALAKLIKAGVLERTATGVAVAAAGRAEPAVRGSSSAGPDSGVAGVNSPTVGPAPADPLEAEIYAAAASRPRVATLLFKVARGPWVRATSRRLISEGYLVSRRTRRTAWTRTLIPAVVLFGAGGVATGTGDSVTGLLFVIIGVIACIWVFRSGMQSTRATPAGSAALARRRSVEMPSATGTQFDPSLRVALFGMRDLERSDPQLAAAVGIPFGDSASESPDA